MLTMCVLHTTDAGTFTPVFTYEICDGSDPSVLRMIAYDFALPNTTGLSRAYFNHRNVKRCMRFGDLVTLDGRAYSFGGTSTWSRVSDDILFTGSPA